MTYRFRRYGMKRILFGFVLLAALATTCRANPLIIFGDSLTAGACSWPQVFSEYGIAVQVAAQPGRMFMDWEPPADLYPFEDARVVIWLGGNDALWGMHKRPTWKSRISDKIATLKQRFGEVIVILPPDFQAFDTSGARDILSTMDATIIDPSAWWYEIETVDGVHPSCSGHRSVAYKLYWSLVWSE
jgi:hypothetical protein